MDGIQVQSVQLSRLIAALHLTLSGMAMPRQRRREATFFMHRQLVMQVQADHAQLAELGDLHQGIRLANALRPFETVVVADIRPGEGIDYLGATRCGALALEQFTLDGTGQLVPAPGPVILEIEDPGLFDPPEGRVPNTVRRWIQSHLDCVRIPERRLVDAMLP